MRGYIYKMEKDRGFGFIRDEKGFSRFMHVTNVERGLFDRLEKGMNVEFTPTEDGPKDNRLRAKDVRLS